MAKTKAKDIADAMGVYTPPKPTITLNEKDNPGIKDYKVDQQVSFTVKGKVIAVERPRYSTDKKLTATIEVSNISGYSAGSSDDEED